MGDVTGTFYPGTADIGYGSEFLVGQGDGEEGPPVVPETFVAIPNVTEVNLGAFTADIIDKTHLRSPGRAHEKMSGLRDFENITVKCDYDRTSGAHKLEGGDGFLPGYSMVALHLNQTPANFMALVGSPGGAPQEEIVIQGVVSGMTRPTLSPSGKMEVTYTITPLHDYLDQTGGGTTAATAPQTASTPATPPAAARRATAAR